MSALSLEEFQQQFFKSGPFANQLLQEIYWLYLKLSALHPLKRMLEVGVLYGGSSCIFDSLLDDKGILVGIDPDLDKLEYQSSRLHTILGLSNNVNVISSAQEYAPYDFIFIDGNHNLATVDFINYFPMLRVGGIIGMHDINDNDMWMRLNAGVKESIEAFSPRWERGYGIGIVTKTDERFCFMTSRPDIVTSNTKLLNNEFWKLEELKWTLM